MNGADITTQPPPENYTNNKKDLAQLIDYYRLVVDTYETERIKNLK